MGDNSLPNLLVGVGPYICSLLAHIFGTYVWWWWGLFNSLITWGSGACCDCIQYASSFLKQSLRIIMNDNRRLFAGYSLLSAPWIVISCLGACCCSKTNISLFLPLCRLAVWSHQQFCLKRIFLALSSLCSVLPLVILITAAASKYCKHWPENCCCHVIN